LTLPSVSPLDAYLEECSTTTLCSFQGACGFLTPAASLRPKPGPTGPGLTTYGPNNEQGRRIDLEVSGRWRGFVGPLAPATP